MILYEAPRETIAGKKIDQHGYTISTTFDYKSCVKNILVVNYPAERAVKDVTEYAKLTANPKHRDNLILVDGLVKKKEERQS